MSIAAGHQVLTVIIHGPCSGEGQRFGLFVERIMNRVISRSPARRFSGCGSRSVFLRSLSRLPRLQKPLMQSFKCAQSNFFLLIFVHSFRLIRKRVLSGFRFLRPVFIRRLLRRRLFLCLLHIRDVSGLVLPDCLCQGRSLQRLGKALHRRKRCKHQYRKQHRSQSFHGF